MRHTANASSCQIVIPSARHTVGATAVLYSWYCILFFALLCLLLLSFACLFVLLSCSVVCLLLLVSPLFFVGGRAVRSTSEYGRKRLAAEAVFCRVLALARKSGGEERRHERVSGRVEIQVNNYVDIYCTYIYIYI